MTLSVVASKAPGWFPRVLIQVSSSPAALAVLRVYRVHEDGSRYRVITSGRAVLNGTWSGYDNHVPFNQKFTYVASTGLEPDSAPSAVCFVSSDKMWLMHPIDTSLSVQIDTVTKVSARKIPSSAQAFKILGSPLPVMRTNGSRGPETWDLEVLADGRDVTETLEALFDADLPVYISSPRSDVLQSGWVQPGDVNIEPPGGYFRTELRLVSFSCTRCSPPDVDLVPLWTYDDLAREFSGSTYSGITGVWPSYADVNLNRRA